MKLKIFTIFLQALLGTAIISVNAMEPGEHNDKKIETLGATSIRFFYDDNPKNLLVPEDPKSGKHNYSKYCTNENNQVWIDAPDVFSFLSNCFPSKINYDPSPSVMVASNDILFFMPTFENAEVVFQILKTPDAYREKATFIEKFSEIESGYFARIVAERVPTRDDWNYQKFDCMENVVYQKFTQNTDLAAQLKATGKATLIHWTVDDDTWGIIRSEENPDACKQEHQASNKLGKILMKIREKLLYPERFLDTVPFSESENQDPLQQV